MDLWISATEEWTLWVSTEHDTVHTLLSFSGTWQRKRVTHAVVHHVAPPWLRRKILKFSPRRKHKKNSNALAAQHQTTHWIYYLNYSTLFIPKCHIVWRAVGHFMVLENKHELNFITEWYHRAKTLTFGLFLDNPSSLRDSASRHKSVLSSVMRYIIVQQHWAQLPELTFPQKSQLIGHQRLEPGVHFEQHNLLQNISSELWIVLSSPTRLQAWCTAQQQRPALPRGGKSSWQVTWETITSSCHISTYINISRLLCLQFRSPAVLSDCKWDHQIHSLQLQSNTSVISACSSHPQEKNSQRHVALKSLSSTAHTPLFQFFPCHCINVTFLLFHCPGSIQCLV